MQAFWRLLDERSKGGKCLKQGQMQKVDLAAAEHLLSTFSVPSQHLLSTFSVPSQHLTF
jgi:hypothetical protein